MKKPKEILAGIFLQNWALKILSLAFALALWIYVSIGQTIMEVPKQVTLELKGLPTDLTRTSDIPGRIDIKVSGSSAQLRSLEDGRLSYELDLSNAAPGILSYKIINTRIKGIPNGVKITEISPSELSIKFSERIQKNLPVEIVTKGVATKGYIVEEKTAEPPLVKVSGAREEIENLKSISTDAIDISGMKESYEAMISLDVMGRHIDMMDNQEVKAKIKITRDLIQREFKNIPISVENTTLEWSVQPKVLNLRLKGPSDTMRELKPEGIKLLIDADGLAEGSHMLKPQLVVPGDKEVIMVGLDLADVHLELGKSKKVQKKLK
jgi:YbbR domain-containing protein